MSLSQKILESTEVIETDDVEEKSVEERENIINDLIYQTLVDLTDESKKLITKYMIDFIL